MKGYIKLNNSKFKQIKHRNDVIKELVNEFFTQDGKSFCNDYTLAKELVLRVHNNFDKGPNDWIYSKVHSMLLDSLDTDFIEDTVDSCIDIYTNDLIEWSKDFISYIDDAIGYNPMTNEFASMTDCITQAQYDVLSEMVSVINDFIDNQGV